MVDTYDRRSKDMTTFAMFTSEGDVALAQRLNTALDTMTDEMDIDQRFEFIEETLRSDIEFSSKHGEWRDTAVREEIYKWLQDETKVDIRDERATVAVEFTFPIEVATLDGDAEAMLGDRSDEIHTLIEAAIQDVLLVIEKRVGRIAGEWSGVQMRVL